MRVFDFLTCNMNKPFFSDNTMRQCNITTLCTCSLLVLLPLVLLLQFISPRRQFRIQILKVEFAISSTYIFYGSIHICLHTCTIDLSSDIEKNPGLRYSSSQNCSVCHWYLNSITAYSYVKMSVLKTFS